MIKVTFINENKKEKNIKRNHYSKYFLFFEARGDKNNNDNKDDDKNNTDASDTTVQTVSGTGGSTRGQPKFDEVDSGPDADQDDTNDYAAGADDNADAGDDNQGPDFTNGDDAGNDAPTDDAGTTDDNAGGDTPDTNIDAGANDTGDNGGDTGPDFSNPDGGDDAGGDGGGTTIDGSPDNAGDDTGDDANADAGANDTGDNGGDTGPDFSNPDGGGGDDAGNPDDTGGDTGGDDANTGNDKKGPGIEYDSTRKYNLFVNYRKLVTTLDNYIDKLENSMNDDIAENANLETATQSLRRIKKLAYDYITIRFDMSSYVQSLLFYQDLIAMIQLVFDFLKKSRKRVRKKSRKSKK